MLTAAAKKHTSPDNQYHQGGGYMKGSYHWHEPAKRYYVNIYWDGKRYKLWKYNGDPIWHEKTAGKMLSKIRAEIDSGIFNIKAYLPDSPVALKKLSKIWLQASTACANTKRVYLTSINRSIKYFGPDFDVRTFTYSKLQTFYNDLDLSIKGKYDTLATLRTLLNFAYKDELIGKVPPFPELPLGLPEEIVYLTFDQQQMLLSAIPPHHRLIFMFMMEYGLRPGEGTALMKDCLTDDEVVIKRTHSDGDLVERTKTSHRTKDSHIRRYGLTSRAKEILKVALKIAPFSPYVFNRDNSGIPYSWKLLNRIWNDASQKTGIKINLYNGVKHSFGGQLMDEGIELELLRDLYGHSSTNTTRRYAHRSQAVMTKVLEFRGRLEDVPEDVQRTNKDIGNG